VRSCNADTEGCPTLDTTGQKKKRKAERNMEADRPEGPEAS